VTDDSSPTVGEEGKAGPSASVYDVLRPDSRPRNLRRLPRLMGRALALVWFAGRREAIIVAILQVVGGGALAAQLLVARSFLASVVGPAPAGRNLVDLLPQLMALGILTAVGGIGAAAVQERQRLLGELTGRYAQGQLLDVAASSPSPAASAWPRLRRPPSACNS